MSKGSARRGLAKKMPFQSKLPETKILSVEGMTRAEFNNELQKGADSIKAGHTHSSEEIDQMLAGEFGI